MKRVLRIVLVALVSSVMLTIACAITSVLFRSLSKTTPMVLLVTWVVLFVLSLLFCFIISLVPKRYEPAKRNLFELVIARHNCGLFLVTMDEDKFRETVIEFMAKSGNEYSPLKLTEYLKSKDAAVRQISYQVVAVSPKIFFTPT